VAPIRSRAHCGSPSFKGSGFVDTRGLRIWPLGSWCENEPPACADLKREPAEVNHDKLEARLKKSCRIQGLFWDVAVSASREFQKSFNGFYCIRRNTEWQAHFYGIMERCKTETMDFDKVLRLVHEATGNIEASFCSKLIATRYPDRPVIDRFVLENLGMALTAPGMPAGNCSISR
jgi:hypothetical protein